MKIALRIALLVVCISLLFFISYKEGATICGTCNNIRYIWWDHCEEDEYGVYYCKDTFMFDKKACCDPGYIPTTTCNTKNEIIWIEHWSLSGVCSGLVYSSCNNVTGCWQNPTWSYPNYNDCELVSRLGATQVQDKVCE